MLQRKLLIKQGFKKLKEGLRNFKRDFGKFLMPFYQK